MGAENKKTTMLYAYGLNVFAKLAEIGFFLLVVKLLSKEDMGLFNTIMSISAFFYLLLNGGIVEAAMREIAETRFSLSAIFFSSLNIRLILVLVSSVLLLVYAHFYVQADKIIAALWYALLFQVMAFLQNLYYAWLKASDRQNSANVFTFVEACLKLLIILAVEPLDLMDLILIWQLSVAAKLIVMLFCFFWVPGKSITYKFKGSSYFIFSGQIYFLLIALLTLVQNRLDWMLIGYFLDQSAVANYSVANKFYEICIFVFGIGATTIYPWICKMQGQGYSAEESKKINVLNRLQIYFAVSAIPVAIIFYPFINQLVWDNRYGEVQQLLVYLLPCLILAVANMKLYYEILALRKERHIVYLACITTIVQTLFNVMAVRVWGVEGAIVGMWLLNMLNVFLYYLLTVDFKIKIKEFLASEPVRMVILAALLLFVCLFLAPVYLVLLWLITAVAVFFYERRKIFAEA